MASSTGGIRAWRAPSIAEKLARAHVIAPLVSPAYLASPCFDEELDVARIRHEAGSVLVIPVLLKPSDVDLNAEARLWFERLRWVPSPPDPAKEDKRHQRCKPITIWADRDEALSRAVAELQQLIDQARGDAAPIGALARRQGDPLDHTLTPGTSGLPPKGRHRRAPERAPSDREVLWVRLFCSTAELAISGARFPYGPLPLMGRGLAHFPRSPA